MNFNRLLLFCLILSCNSVWAQEQKSPLDGKEYDIKFTKKGDSSVKVEDVFSFNNGKLSSKVLKEEGYTEAVYSLEYDTLSADTAIIITFEAELINSKTEKSYTIEGKVNASNLKKMKGNSVSYAKNKPKASYVFSGALRKNKESGFQSPFEKNDNSINKKTKSKF
jgi:hypothetical protein